MKKAAYAIVTLALLYLAASIINNTFYIYKPFKLGMNWADLRQTEEEKNCLQFIEREMDESSYGIYTNYLDKTEATELAGGHEVLSESEGIIMLYSVQKGDKAMFDKHFSIVKNNMTMKSGLIRWRINRNSGLLPASSASIDDLRIIRALFFAYDRWGDKEYRKMLVKVARAVRSKELYQNCLVDFYDENMNTKAKTLTLSYIDLYTVELLSRLDSKWNKVRASGDGIISGARISEEFPLYHKSFDIDSGKYSDDSEINIIDSLLVALHLSEVSERPDEVLKWIKGQLEENQGVFLSYDARTGRPTSNNESTAAYGIIAQIAANTGDLELQKKAEEKMLKYQITDATSKLYGAFGTEIKKEVYSFDNLQALLGLQKYKYIKVNE